MVSAESLIFKSASGGLF